jgi:NADH-quinone oxidoreductase subunit C
MPAARLAEILGRADVPASAADEPLGAVVRLEAACVPEALAALRLEGFEFFVDLFGTDTGEGIELTYHVRSLGLMEDAYLKAAVAYDGEAPSVWSVFPAALYPEREAAELLGMAFPGHPNPKRLLTVDDSLPYLRKSVPVRTAEEVRRS